MCEFCDNCDENVQDVPGAPGDEQNANVFDLEDVEGVIMMVTLQNDNGLYEVALNDKARNCLRLLLAAMHGEAPVRLVKVAEVTMVEEIQQQLDEPGNHYPITPADADADAIH
ncbi:hypothetical protein KCT17_003665 [Escherichia coli]|nr:hypothetical protein [Escherichia coli]